MSCIVCCEHGPQQCNAIPVMNSMISLSSKWPHFLQQCTITLHVLLATPSLSLIPPAIVQCRVFTGHDIEGMEAIPPAAEQCLSRSITNGECPRHIATPNTIHYPPQRHFDNYRLQWCETTLELLTRHNDSSDALQHNTAAKSHSIPPAAVYMS